MTLEHFNSISIFVLAQTRPAKGLCWMGVLAFYVSCSVASITLWAEASIMISQQIRQDASDVLTQAHQKTWIDLYNLYTFASLPYLGT